MRNLRNNFKYNFIARIRRIIEAIDNLDIRCSAVRFLSDEGLSVVKLT